MFEMYTDAARNSVHSAKCEAQLAGAEAIGPDHLLLAVLQDEQLVNDLDLKGSADRIRLVLSANSIKSEADSPRVDLPLSKEAHFALESAAEEASRLSCKYIDNEHILLGILRTEEGHRAFVGSEGNARFDFIKFQLEELKANREENFMRSPESAHSRQTDLDPRVRVTLDQVRDMQQRGDRRALTELMDNLISVDGQDHVLMTRFFGHLATVTALEIGDYERANRYCEMRLSVVPKEPMALLDFAECLKQAGRLEEAKAKAAECYEESLARGNSYGKTMIELVKMRFPNADFQSR